MRAATNLQRYLLAALTCVIALSPAVTRATTDEASNDVAYASHLAEQFAILGEHRLAFAHAEVSHGLRGRFPFTLVRFEVTAEEATWLMQHGRQTELRAWGDALHRELRARYGERDFVAALQWRFYAKEAVDGSLCHTTVAYAPEQGGWLHAWHFVRVLDDGEVQVCAFH